MAKRRVRDAERTLYERAEALFGPHTSQALEKIRAAETDDQREMMASTLEYAPQTLAPLAADWMPRFPGPDHITKLSQTGKAIATAHENLATARSDGEKTHTEIAKKHTPEKPGATREQIRFAATRTRNIALQEIQDLRRMHLKAAAASEQMIRDHIKTLPAEARKTLLEQYPQWRSLASRIPNLDQTTEKNRPLER